MYRLWSGQASAAAGSSLPTFPTRSRTVPKPRAFLSWYVRASEPMTPAFLLCRCPLPMTACWRGCAPCRGCPHYLAVYRCCPAAVRTVWDSTTHFRDAPSTTRTQERSGVYADSMYTYMAVSSILHACLHAAKLGPSALVSGNLTAATTGSCLPCWALRHLLCESQQCL